MANEKLEIGQILYKPVYLRNQPPTIKEVSVTKIVRTYFYVEGDERTPIRLDNLTHEDKMYSQCNFTLYKSDKEIFDMWEASKLRGKLSQFFNWSGNYKKLSLNQLTRINEIIEETNPNAKA